MNNNLLYNGQLGDMFVPNPLIIPPKGEKGHSLVKFMTNTEWAILPEKLEQLELVVQQFIAGNNVMAPNKGHCTPGKRAADITGIFRLVFI